MWLVMSGGLLATLTAGSALAVAGSGSEPTAGNAPASCVPPPLRFRGVEYHARPQPTKLKAGRRVGRGVSLDRACIDVVVCHVGQPCTPPPPPPVEFRPIDVFRLVGVNPRIAVVRKDLRGWVWVATDRCRTADSPASLRRCLRAGEDARPPAAAFASGS